MIRDTTTTPASPLVLFTSGTRNPPSSVDFFPFVHLLVYSFCYYLPPFRILLLCVSVSFCPPLRKPLTQSFSGKVSTVNPNLVSSSVGTLLDILVLTSISVTDPDPYGTPPAHPDSRNEDSAPP